MKTRKRHNRTELYPHVVKLPHRLDAFQYSIFKQEAVLYHYEDAPKILRSAKPFSIKIGNKVYYSKLVSK